MLIWRLALSFQSLFSSLFHLLLLSTDTLAILQSPLQAGSKQFWHRYLSMFSFLNVNSYALWLALFAFDCPADESSCLDTSVPPTQCMLMSLYIRGEVCFSIDCSVPSSLDGLLSAALEGVFARLGDYGLCFLGNLGYFGLNMLLDYSCEQIISADRFGWQHFRKNGFYDRGLGTVIASIHLRSSFFPISLSRYGFILLSLRIQD